MKDGPTFSRFCYCNDRPYEGWPPDCGLPGHVAPTSHPQPTPDLTALGGSWGQWPAGQGGTQCPRQERSGSVCGLRPGGWLIGEANCLHVLQTKQYTTMHWTQKPVIESSPLLWRQTLKKFATFLVNQCHSLFIVIVCKLQGISHNMICIDTGLARRYF